MLSDTLFGSLPLILERDSPVVPHSPSCDFERFRRALKVKNDVNNYAKNNARSDFNNDARNDSRNDVNYDARNDARNEANMS